MELISNRSAYRQWNIQTGDWPNGHLAVSIKRSRGNFPRLANAERSGNWTLLVSGPLFAINWHRTKCIFPSAKDEDDFIAFRVCVLILQSRLFTTNTILANVGMELKENCLGLILLSYSSIVARILFFSTVSCPFLLSIFIFKTWISRN